MGTKKNIILDRNLFLVSAIGSALAPNPYFSPFFYWWHWRRASSVAAPIYISETTPKGKLGTLFNLILFSES
jgi:hypothetical protein